MLQDQRAVGTRRAALVAVGAVALLAVSACGGGSSSPVAGKSSSFYTGGTPGGTPVHGGTVVIDQGESPGSLDPAAATGGGPAQQRASMALYDGLTEMFPGSEEPQPALAASWSISPDRLTYTFHIRSGVRFSDGDPLTGEDVVYTIQRDERTGGLLGGLLKQSIRRAATTGPMTVKIELVKRRPTFLGELAVPTIGAIVSKKAAEHESEQQFAQHPVGTGPFMLKSTTPGNSTVVLVRNPYYWRGGGRPYLNSLILNTIENDNSRILAVRSGAATIALNVSYAQAADLRKTPGVRMLIQPLWGASLNAINDTKPPLTEVNVRRALMYATPFAEIIKTVYKGFGTQANSVSGRMKFWNPHVPYYTYDLAKARALLKTTSVPNGFPVTIDCTGGETVCELTASIMQSSWAKIGVHVNIHTVSSSTVETDFITGKYQVSLLPPESGVNETPETEFANYSYLSGALFSSVRPSAHLKELIERSYSEPSESARRKLDEEIQYVSYWKEPSWIPIVNLASLNLVSESLRGFTVLPGGRLRLEQMWLAR